MALRKIKLGKYIYQSDEKNSNLELSLDQVRGISTQKMFIDTKANMEGVPLNNYRIVRPNQFAYVPDTSRRGNKISLAFNNTRESYLVSSISVVFYVDEKEINPEYLFMYFNRPEFDRYSRYNSFGSAREPFNWEDMCDIEIELPDIDTQRKFVDVYLSMLDNQKLYEQGLEDLKLVCDGYIESLKSNLPLKPLKNILKRRNEKNDDINAIYLGISVDGFIEPKQELSEGNILHKKKFYMDDFIFTPSGVNHHNTTIESGVCSHVNEMFYNDNPDILSEYIELWLKRKEFLRYCDFYNISSVMSNFNYDTFSGYFIPVPTKKIQQSIVNIYKCYLERKEINEKLKAQIKDICPILIKGSIEEAKEA